MNDAFGYGRRSAVSVAYLDPAGRFTLTGGVWGQDIADGTSSVNGLYRGDVCHDLQHHRDKTMPTLLTSTAMAGRRAFAALTLR